MKKLFLLYSSCFLLLSACQKDQSDTSNTSTAEKSAVKKTYSRVDTTTKTINKQMAVKGATASAASDNYAYGFQYLGQGAYKFSIYVFPTGGSNVTLTLFRNNVAYKVYSNVPGGMGYVFQDTYPVGSYYIKMTSPAFQNPREYNTAPFEIVSPPSVPAGQVAIIQYYNSQAGKHFYSNDFEELGSGSQGYRFEKTQGYLSQSYPNPDLGPGSPVYQFFNPTSGGHYYALSSTTPAGYTYERILGYIATIPYGPFGSTWKHYYSSQADNHFYCKDPEVPVPAATGYVYQNYLGYMH